MTQATKTRKQTEITSPVVFRCTDKVTGEIFYAVPSDSGNGLYKVTFNEVTRRYEDTCPAKGDCKHCRAVREVVLAKAEIAKQGNTSPAPQFEEGQEVLYSYCPDLAFTGIIAGKRTRLNGEDGYMLQTKFWTEVVPVRFLTSKETPAATTEQTHRVSCVHGVAGACWYPEYNLHGTWYRFPQPDGGQAVSFVVEGRAEQWVAERIASVEESKAERKMSAFRREMDKETAESNLRAYYNGL